MNRVDLRARWMVVLALAFVSACASKDPQVVEVIPHSSPPVNQADVAPLPDFHNYVVGEMADPAMPSRDPFVGELRRSIPTARKSSSVTRSKPREARLELRGIMQFHGRPIALLGAASAGVGEIVQGWTVISIENGRVVLERNGQRRTLEL